MSDVALQTAKSISMPRFAVLVGILIDNSRSSDLHAPMDAGFSDSERRWDARFEDLKETWRFELRRVEHVLDARLKHPRRALASFHK